MKQISKRGGYRAGAGRKGPIEGAVADSEILALAAKIIGDDELKALYSRMKGGSLESAARIHHLYARVRLSILTERVTTAPATVLVRRPPKNGPDTPMLDLLASGKAPPT